MKAIDWKLFLVTYPIEKKKDYQPVKKYSSVDFPSRHYKGIVLYTGGYIISEKTKVSNEVYKLCTRGRT